MFDRTENERDQLRRLQNRRQLFGAGASGIGAAALASLINGESSAANGGLAGTETRAGFPGTQPKAKNIIYLFMNGAPTHVDLFDYKPQLSKQHGKPMPENYFKGKRFSTMTGNPAGKVVLQPVEPFRQHGESGATVSRFLPYTAAISDELCFIKSMYTEQVNHSPAVTFFLTGAEMAGRPAIGAWLTYGLGSESQDLPGYVVMTSISKGTTCGQIFYDYYWGSGFLPSRFQGVKFRGGGDPVLYLSNPDGISRQVRRDSLDGLSQLNQMRFDQIQDPEILSGISQYEMAYKMQASVPELTDLGQEPRHVLEMYGPSVQERGSFAYNCLMARRLVERGTRFVQVMHAGWDQHNSLTTELYTQCKDTDQPSAALVKDLKQRGLLEDTIVIWGGEFGRTPFLQGDMKNRKRWGRDHHPYAFTLWLAGGGFKPGFTYGASDDLGMNAVVDPVHVHDFQATLLHQLGIDHEQLTFKHQGRRFRLTDVHGKVIRSVLA